MCLDLHPQHPNLLAIGCYDGTVAVLDLRNGGHGGRSKPCPLYSSAGHPAKHTGPVWAVRWQHGEGGGLASLTFMAAAEDGRVTLWSLAQAKLGHQARQPSCG